MDGRKFTATLVALVAGIVLSAGSAPAAGPYSGTAGYLQGDPAPGKLIPYFLANDTTSTIIGIENTIGNAGPFGAELDIPTPINNTFVHIAGGDISVHIHIFDKFSDEILNFTKCYSPYDFGYIVLQKGAVSSAQNADLDFPTGPNATRRNKSQVVVLSTTEGYVSIRATRVYATGNGTCGSESQFTVSVDIPDAYDLLPVSVWGGPLSWPLATWAILADVSSGFFATEIPTATARVDEGSGRVRGGIGAFGLIPEGNEVISRYDANPFNQSVSRIFTWFTSNGNSVPLGFLDCEDEAEISTSFPFPTEAGFFVLSGTSDPATHSDVKDALAVCANSATNQYRGVVRFTMPDTGFIWTHITQQGAHFRENYLGYNLQNNWFIDCADGYLTFGRPDGQDNCLQ